jgi:tetratricopeptide (TPR) repeat protein
MPEPNSNDVSGTVAPPPTPAQRLWQLWRQGQRPDVRAFLAPAGELTAEQVAAALLVDQRERWRNGERVPAEAYLDLYPHRRDDFEFGLELVYGEYLLREECGESPDLEGYIRRFPAYADRLKIQVELHEAMRACPTRPPLSRDGCRQPETLVDARGGKDLPWPTVPGYEIVAELGRGGMGVVYQARHLALKRTVALKMILAGAYAGVAERVRFTAEVEAVARLQHPNIVQIHEVGEVDGRPYCALEFLDGGSLAQRLDGKPLAAKEAARLVKALAQAVQLAHSRNIVHRDLKPANILLAADGTPKVTDFGLARRLDSQSGQTQSGAILGTPAYMAPEQASGQAHTAGPAADLYALGAILYQCLTGRRPFESATALETLEHVRTRAPAAPRSLNPRVPRDLETICLRCLRKEPEQRYSSARDLADDLGRFLRGEPVLARPTGWWVKGVMWVKRRPALAALLATVIIGPSIGLVLLERARRQTEAEGRKARVEAAKAEAINRFLTEDLLFQASPSENARAKQVTVEELLDRAAARIDQAFPNQPEVEAAIRIVIGKTYWNLGKYGEAEPYLQRALDLRREHLGLEHPHTLLAMTELASLLDHRGKYPEAERLNRQALEIWERVSGPEHPETLTVRCNLGVVRKHLGDWEEAERLYRQVLEAGRRTQGLEHSATLLALTNLSELLRGQQKFAEAELYSRQALEARQKIQGSEHPSTLSALNNLAALLQDQSKLADAEPLWRQVLTGRKRVLGPKHPDTLQSMSNLAGFLKKRGDTATAEPLYGQALEGLRETLGPEHPLTLTTQFNLAALLLDRGKPAEAEPQFRALLASYRLGSDNRQTANALHRLGEALVGQGKWAEAEASLREALQIRHKELPADHSDTGATLIVLGQALTKKGKPAEAESFLQKGLAIRRQNLPAGHWLTASAESLLGACLTAQSRFGEAEALLQRSYETLEKATGAPPLRRREAVDRLIRLYESWDKPEKAAEWRAKRDPVTKPGEKLEMK